MNDPNVVDHVDPDRIIETVCRDHGLTLVDAAVEGVSVLAARFGILEDWLVGHSYLIGGTRVVLGVYDSPDIRLAAFFHEVGHHLDVERVEGVEVDKMFREKSAWKRGLALAASDYGLSEWSSFVVEYIEVSLRSYVPPGPVEAI